jgi:glycosyltransferase involved in cell wall biosynthesis
LDFNLTGPIAQTGYGIVFTNILVSLIDRGHNVALWPIPRVQDMEADPKHHEKIRQAINNQAFYNDKAASIRKWHQFDLAQHVGRGPRVGYPVFELDRFTEREIHHLRSQDILFTPTEWSKTILAGNSIGVETHVVPYGVDREIFHEGVEAVLPDLKKNNTTVFINIGKAELRKGHDVLVDVFNSAFEPSDNVHLIVAFYNPFYTPEENREWIDLYKNSKMGQHTTVLEGRLATQYDVAGLIASADCGVFPSRSEGWGLEGLETLSMGKQLITTNYSGHTAYATNENSLLIEIDELEVAYDGRWFTNGIGQWGRLGESQIDQLIEHMRNIHKRKQTNGNLFNQSGIDCANRFSWKNTAEKIESILS